MKEISKILGKCMLVAFWALGAQQAEAREWLGLPQECREAVVERALVDGLCISDSVWDLSDAAIIEPYAGYRVERYAPGRYIMREGRQRYYFAEAGDTLLWTGYENRLMLSTGAGAPVLMPWGAEHAGGAYALEGMYSQQVPVSEQGMLWSESRPATLIMNGDTISDAVSIRTVRTIAAGDSAQMRQESVRLYVRGCSAPVAEARRMAASDSAAAGWDTQLMLLSVLDGGALPVQAPRQAAARPQSKIGLTASQAPSGSVTATFDIALDGTDAELLLCSPSGIVYWSRTLSGLPAGRHSATVATGGYPGPLLLMVIAGSESEKVLVRQ